MWTVDLAHLLRRFGLEVSYKTLTLGTNPGFTGEAFYEQMHEDAIRVDQLFQVETCQIPLCWCTVWAEALQNNIHPEQSLFILFLSISKALQYYPVTLTPSIVVCGTNTEAKEHALLSSHT